VVIKIKSVKGIFTVGEAAGDQNKGQNAKKREGGGETSISVREREFEKLAKT